MSKHFPYPYLQIRCRVHSRDFRVSAYVDSGYEGGLVIPESERSGLPSPSEEALIQLADGTCLFGGQYEGTLMLEDLGLKVTVLFLGNEYLIGREVIDQLRLCFHHGQYLEIET